MLQTLQKSQIKSNKTILIYPNLKMFCKKLDHLRNFQYCEECATNLKPLKFVFFCQCQRTIRLSHGAHPNDVFFIDNEKDEKFFRPVARIKDLIMVCIQNLKQKNRRHEIVQNFQAQLNKAKQNIIFLKLIDPNVKFVELITDVEIMTWLLQVQFWQAGKQTQFINFESKLKKVMEKKFSEGNVNFEKIINFVPVQNINRIRIDWDQNYVNQDINNAQDIINTEMAKMKRQSDIYNFILKLFSSYTIKQCYDTSDQCEALLKIYPQSKVLFLSLIRLNQLISSGNKQIPKILERIKKNVDDKFDSTDLYHYYMAMAQWKMIDEPETEHDMIFYELKNKKFYKLENVEAYLESLKKAINIKQKAVYYFGLGLGYVHKKEYGLALDQFEKASKLINHRSDALDLNKFWTQSHVYTASGQQQFQSIMQNLQTRTVQFIINMCKYFKKSQTYQKLVDCCEQLIARQPTNSSFKIQFIKSILYYSSCLEQFRRNDNEKIQRADKMIVQLKRVRQDQAAKLEKRLQRVKAKHQFKHQKYLQASEGFQQLARGSKLTSASDYYNFASTLFKLFMQSQCTDEDFIKKAYVNIKKALQLKPKSTKYINLLFYICCYMNHFNEANAIYEFFKQNGQKFIDETQYERLIEHIKMNMQVEVKQEWSTPTGKF